VADLDGNGDELYVVKEAVTSAEAPEPLVPVTIMRYQHAVSIAEGRGVHHSDRQCRFLLTSDLDGDGRPELVAATFKAGLWLIAPTPIPPWRRELIDAESSGFEHACVTADMDGDGAQELYVASDDQKELRSYRHTEGRFVRTALLPWRAMVSPGG